MVENGIGEKPLRAGCWQYWDNMTGARGGYNLAVACPADTYFQIIILTE